MSSKVTIALILVCCVFAAPICSAQSAKTNKSKKDKSSAAAPSTDSTATNSDADKKGAPIAMIAGQPIYEDDLLPNVASKLIPLHNQEYQIKKQALESLIDQKLLEAEAKKKGVPADKFLEQEIDAKIADPTDGELNAYYLGQKNQLGNRPFDDVKAQLKNSLKQAKIQQARQDFYFQLRKESTVAVLLEAPKIRVSYDPARVRGNPKAPVMIVEFSDFQCPYCQAVEPTIKAVLAKHTTDVAFAFRDLPLTSIHPLAQGAAEAARCAGEQGKFWEYHDLLFTDRKLDHDGLVSEARNLRLDEKQFDSCLTTEKYKAQIQADAQDGMRAGVSGTPGFFVNGIYLDGNQPEPSFEKAIQDALTSAQNKTTAKLQ